MQRGLFIFRQLILTGLLLCFVLPNVGEYARAQNSAQDEAGIALTQISEQSINAQIKETESDTALDADTKTSVLEIYNNALGRLSDAKTDGTKANIFKNQREDAPKELKRVQELIEQTRTSLVNAQTNLAQMFVDLSADDIQQQMIEKRGEIATQRALLEQLQTARQTNDQRPALAREELAQTQQKISVLSENISAQKTEDLTPSDKANNMLARSVLAARQQHQLLLDQEIISLPVNQNILASRIELTDLRVQLAEKILTALQIKSGVVRSIEAEQRFKTAKAIVKTMEGRHPLLADYANENMNLALKLSKSIGLTPEDLPATEASIRRQLDQVDVDNKVADQIISSGKVSKNFGAHLRKLRKKQPSISEISGEVKRRSTLYEEALFQRIVNREALQSFSGGTLDVTAEKALFDGFEEPSPELSEEDLLSLHALYVDRRELLSVLASATDLKSRRLEGVNSEQNYLLEKIIALNAKLDSRLLWLPSTEPVGLEWPGKVTEGIGTIIKGNTLIASSKVFWAEININIFLLLLIIILAGGFYVARTKFKPLIDEMSKRVGRVQKDTYLLTPTAILDGLFKAAPWALIPLFVAMIFTIAPHAPNGAANGLPPIVRTSLVLTTLILVLSTLRAWSEKGALFDLHYRVDWELRRRLVKNVPWLLATQFISVILIGFTRDNLDYDTGIAALGILGFLIGSLGIAVFAIKLAWHRTGAFENYRKDSVGIYLRYEKWFFLIAIAFPIGTSLLAAFGYYESARLLLTRFFISFCVLIIAYVIHGLLRRSVVIAQRRLALEEARARRDRVVEERRAKVAAEERGEITIPNVDYERIDLETVNRQSIQLVNIAVFIGTAGIFWALWGNLLPALSVFNDVTIREYIPVDGAGNALMIDGVPSVVRITLWSVMQAFAIGMIAWLAARNLPGFLEIFVLKRMGMTQASRYALVTVLGYIIGIIGVVMAFNKLGTQWSQLQWIIAALGVGIGFGLQAIFANFISGLIILFERPVRIGDFISIGEISGTVSRIQIRATTLLDLDNKEILIPNQELISQHVTNWTLSNAVTRLIVKVGIAYGSDTAKAHKLMLATIKENPNVLNHPEPTVLFLGFGDSSLDFELRVFLRDFKQRFIVSHELHMAVDQALRDVGIEIPFPQRDLNVKNPEALGAALGGTNKPVKKTAKKVAAKKNVKP